MSVSSCPGVPLTPSRGDDCGEYDAGVPAAVACPVSCGTCGIGLCYENGKFKSCKMSTYSTDETDEES